MTTSTRIGAAAAFIALVAAGPLAAQQPAGSQKHEPAAGSHKQEPAGSQKRESEEAEEHTLAESRVPAPAREAFHRAYPHATARKWTSEVENGRTIYEVESVDGTVRRDINIGADGTILETETQVAPAQLPAPVRSAAEANGAHIDLAEVVVVGRDTTYEMRIRGRQVELKLLPNGHPVPATRQ